MGLLNLSWAIIMYLVFPPRLWLCMHVCKEICLMYAATTADLKCDLVYGYYVSNETAAAG